MNWSELCLGSRTTTFWKILQSDPRMWYVWDLTALPCRLIDQQLLYKIYIRNRHNKSKPLVQILWVNHSKLIKSHSMFIGYYLIMNIIIGTEIAFMDFLVNNRS